MKRVIVHTLAQARAALADDPAMVIESPPGAAGHHGIGWWGALLAELPPGTASVLDCGDAPGLALAAIRAGIPCIRLDAPPQVLAKVASIAAQAHIRVVPPGEV